MSSESVRFSDETVSSLLLPKRQQSLADLSFTCKGRKTAQGPKRVFGFSS